MGNVANLAPKKAPTIVAEPKIKAVFKLMLPFFQWGIVPSKLTLPMTKSVIAIADLVGTPIT